MVDILVVTMVTYVLMKHSNHSKLIDDLGGPSAIAQMFGISSQAVTKWRRSGIPDDKLIRLAPIAESRGIATRKDLLPNVCNQIWPELSN